MIEPVPIIHDLYLTIDACETKIQKKIQLQNSTKPVLRSEPWFPTSIGPAKVAPDNQPLVLLVVLVRVALLLLVGYTKKIMSKLNFSQHFLLGLMIC